MIQGVTRAPKVSVIMSVYNAENHLRQAIESILSQSFSDFELIVADDGSTDHSFEIINSYCDQRIRAMRAPLNQGLYHVRNRLLGVAKGEYVAVLDSDDVALPDRLRIQAEFLDQNAGVVLVGTRYELIDEKGVVTGVSKILTDSLEISWRLLFGNCFGHSTVMYRLNEAKLVGGYGDFAPAEDYSLWTRLVARGRAVNLDRITAKYRVHASGASSTTTEATKELNTAKIVATSIHLHTGQAIDLDVAKVVARDIFKPAANACALTTAYDTIGKCLLYVLNSRRLTDRQRKIIVSSAVQDLLRLAKKNPLSLGQAQTKALRYLVKYDPSSLVKKRYIGMLADKILPSGVARAARRITRADSLPPDTRVQS